MPSLTLTNTIMLPNVRISYIRYVQVLFFHPLSSASTTPPLLSTNSAPHNTNAHTSPHTRPGTTYLVKFPAPRSASAWLFHSSLARPSVCMSALRIVCHSPQPLFLFFACLLTPLRPKSPHPAKRTKRHSPDLSKMVLDFFQPRTPICCMYCSIPGGPLRTI